MQEVVDLRRAAGVFQESTASFLSQHILLGAYFENSFKESAGNFLTFLSETLFIIGWNNTVTSFKNHNT